MKIWVALVILLIIPVSIAKDVDIPKVFETEKGLTEETTYFYTGDKLLASKDSSGITYHYQNRLNSDINSKSLPFGQEINNQKRFSFTGKELDEGLYYFGARYYDPNIGKFTSVDPVKSEPPYQYVKNNPMNLIDPDGRQTVETSFDEFKSYLKKYFKPEIRRHADKIVNMAYGEVSFETTSGERSFSVYPGFASNTEFRNTAFELAKDYYVNSYMDGGATRIEALRGYWTEMTLVRMNEEVPGGIEEKYYHVDVGFDNVKWYRGIFRLEKVERNIPISLRLDIALDLFAEGTVERAAVELRMDQDNKRKQKQLDRLIFKRETGKEMPKSSWTDNIKIKRNFLNDIYDFVHR